MDAVAFSAGTASETTAPVWQANLPRDLVAARRALAAGEAGLVGEAGALAAAEQWLSQFAATSGRTPTNALAFAVAQGPEAELSNQGLTPAVPGGHLK